MNLKGSIYSRAAAVESLLYQLGPLFWGQCCWLDSSSVRLDRRPLWFDTCYTTRIAYISSVQTLDHEHASFRDVYYSTMLRVQTCPKPVRSILNQQFAMIIREHIGTRRRCVSKLETKETKEGIYPQQGTLRSRLQHTPILQWAHFYSKRTYAGFAVGMGRGASRMRRVGLNRKGRNDL